MTWIKLNDNTTRHPKVARLSDRAFRVWIDSLCYASEFLTDGLLPPAFLTRVKQAIQDELVVAGLWDVHADASVSIHDYLEHQTSRESVEQERRRNRDRRRGVRGTPADRTAGTPAGTPEEKPRPEYREQRTDTEIREQTVPPAPAKPLISGQANPRDWGKIHGNHVAGFCDWVCLPDFVFEEFRSKSPGPEYVKGWAARIRQEWEGQTIGEDGLKFWRARWSDSHRTAATAKPIRIQELLDKEAARKAGTAS